MIDIEQRTLRAFKQHVGACLALGVKQIDRVVDQRTQVAG